MADQDAYHHGDLRRALLEAAERLVVRRGAPEVSLRAIAREANVSPAAPYHHFESREEILAGVAASGFRALTSAMKGKARAASEAGSLEKLRAVGIAYVEFAEENPEIFRLMFGGLLADRERFRDLAEASGAARSVLGDLAAGANAGDGGDALSDVALTAWSAVHGLAFLAVEGLLDARRSETEAGELARRVTAVLGRGLAGGGGEPED